MTPAPVFDAGHVRRIAWLEMDISDIADEEPQTYADELLREVALSLACEGGRVFVQSATGENLESCTIELKCAWSPRLATMFDETIRIGNSKRKPMKWDDDGEEIIDEAEEEETGWSLLDVPVMLTIHSVTSDWIAESASKNEGTPVLGRFIYYEADESGSAYDRPCVTAWVGLGPTNFNLVRDRLVSTEKPDFEVGLTVRFPRSSIRSSWVGKDVVWDGEGTLPVTGATLVWLRGDWNSESGPEPRDPVQPVPIRQELPRDHVELLSSISRLEAAIVKLSTPLWIAVAAAIVAVFLAR